VSGDVQTKDRVKVTDRNAFHIENSVNGETMTKRKVKMNVPLNARYNTTLPCNFSFLCFKMYMNVRTYHSPCA
jgi:nitrous oxide reductase